VNDVTFLFVQFDDVWLWHKRLCHLNFDNLVSISKMKRVGGLPKLKKPDNVICKQCQLGKMTKSSFKSKTHNSKDILELVHTDLCGPIDVQSYKHDKYIILFVDDYSRMMTVMFFKKNLMLFKCLSGMWQELKRKLAKY
jgi:hypothetical protein